MSIKRLKQVNNFNDFLNANHTTSFFILFILKNPAIVSSIPINIFYFLKN